MDIKNNTRFLLLSAIPLLLLLLSSSSELVKSVNAQSTGYTAYGAFAFNGTGPLAGISGLVSVHSPFVFRPADYSAGVIALFSANPKNVFQNTALIIMGYIVFPGRYGGDRRPRLFVQYFNMAPNGTVTGCFDLDCPGFVKTENLTKIGTVLQGQSTMRLSIQQDRNTKNWEFRYGNSLLGYYPNSLFTGAGDRGFNFAGVGGIVFDAAGDTTPNLKQMGSGVFGNVPIRSLAAYITDIQLVEVEGSGRRIIDLNVPQGLNSVTVQRVTTNPVCYSVGIAQQPTTFFYGGPGCLN